MPRTVAGGAVNKVMISLSAEHAAFLDRQRARGLTRSQVIREALDRLINDPFIFLPSDMPTGHIE